jgi:hypothetical protein
MRLFLEISDGEGRAAARPHLILSATAARQRCICVPTHTMDP